MIKIKLYEDSFLKIKETLTRMGIANNNAKTIWQSCHILQKKGEYYIVHFKELLKLDGKVVNYDEEDMIRTTNIARMLQDWGLCEIISDISLVPVVNNFRIISFKDKETWTLKAKYVIN